MTPAPACEGAEASAPREGTFTQTQESALSRPSTGAAPRPLPRGATLGRYVVLEYLGAGGMGVVYSAYDFGLDRKVSLKLVRGDRRDASDRQARLLREAQAMARLSHPNVIAVHDVGTFEDQLFIAMEFAGGGTLKQWLRARPRSWREVVDIFLLAGRGLAAAHRAGLIHRDFKPTNVLLGEDGRPRVTDFGLAVHASREEESAERQEFLPPGHPPSASGTAAYMAPEQRKGLPLDPRADQYSFCVALHEGLFGERPTAEGDATARSATGPHVPRRLMRLLQRGLAPEPAGRFPSLDALLEELERSRHPARRGVAAAGAFATVGAFVALMLLAAPGRPRDESQVGQREVSGPPSASLEPRAIEPVFVPVDFCPAAPAPRAAAPVPPRLEPSTPSGPRPPAVASVAGTEPRPEERAATLTLPPPAAQVGSSWTPRPEPRPASSGGRTWAEDARSLSKRLQQERSAPGPLARAVVALLDQVARALDGEEPSGGDPMLAFAQLAAPPGNGAAALGSWPLPHGASGQSAAARSAQPLLPAASPDLPGSSGGDIVSQTEGNGSATSSGRLVAGLQKNLAELIANHQGLTEIAQARFELAQALWNSRQDPTGAIEQARLAQQDLADAGQGESTLRTQVDEWLKNKVELRYSGQPGLNDF